MNETEYIFSESINGFLPIAWKGDKEESGTWPSDAVEITYECYLEFTSDAPKGKILGSVNGFPAWIDTPPLSHEDMVYISDIEKTSRIDQANLYMNGNQWPGKAALGRLSESEKAQYNSWLDYLDALYAVDTSTAPDIDWPVEPAK